MENHIAALRKQRRLSQEELAQAVGDDHLPGSGQIHRVATARVQAGALFWMLD
jgi:transcriptional regulator with XRE-family HTH domain